MASIKGEAQEQISMRQEAENVYVNIRDAYESGMTHWKEALLVSFRQQMHPMVKDHVKYLILKNRKAGDPGPGV